jgi:hypothetical protein
MASERAVQAYAEYEDGASCRLAPRVSGEQEPIIPHLVLIRAEYPVDSGFWRTWRRHGLIGLEGDSSLTLQALAVYTESTAQYCQTFTSHHLDPIADWAGKVYDIAMTAVHTVKTIQSTMTRDGHVDASFDATRHVLLASAYKLASTLTLVSVCPLD